jgi:uncharacterized protein
MDNTTAPSRAIPGWTATESPFHKEELAVQDRLGVRERIDTRVRRAGIRSYMPDQHRTFFNALPFLLVGSTDADGQPWASILVGRPGFISAPDSRTLRIAASSLPGSPAQDQLQVGALIGALGIQLTTRRRNRVNGVITAADESSLTLAVSQSFGNCSRYIQCREFYPLDDDGRALAQGACADADHLGDADLDLIARADTFFIASANLACAAGAARGVDVSHRGGRPGFVRADDVRTLTMPDFSGNSYFNTIGNLVHDPRAGLLFIDFESGDLLYAAGDTEIIWDGPEVEAFVGAERLMRFHLREVRRSSHALRVRWSQVQYAPELTRTGTWQESDAVR